MEHSFEQHWPDIEPVVKKLIFNQEISKKQWQNLFCDVHMICSWDETGCMKLVTALHQEISSLLADIANHLSSINDYHQVLKEYVACWLEFNDHCKRIPVAFQQLDLATRPNNSKKGSESTVRNLMLKLWSQQIIVPFSHRLQHSALDLIKAERNGHIIDNQLIVTLRQSFAIYNNLPKSVNQNNANNNSLPSYAANNMQRFDCLYLQELEIFYSVRANDYLRERGVLDYIKWATSKLEKEERRADLYLEPSSKSFQYVKDLCKRVFVKDFVDQVLIEVPQYIRVNDTENIGLIFRFINRVEGFAEKLFQELESHILANGLDHLMSSLTLLNKNNSCEKYVDKLLEFYNQFYQVIRISFDLDPRAKAVLDKAFEVIINDSRVRSAELLANYCDLLLRRTSLSRKLTSQDIDCRLSELVHIIRLLKDKDKEAFLTFYKAHLTKRLLLNASANYEKEEEFVRTLRVLPEMPFEHMHKLTRMLKDLKNSEELKDRYRQIVQPLYDIESIETQIKILNPSAWTKSKESFPINLPKELTSFMSGFEAFYSDQNRKRKLDWCNQLSNGTITINSNKGSFDLNVTAAQLSVISCYLDDPSSSKTIQDLKAQTNLIPGELKKALKSLVVNPKLESQVILCEPLLLNINDLDRETNKYSINPNFARLKHK